jgi:hypothetical protein
VGLRAASELANYRFPVTNSTLTGNVPAVATNRLSQRLLGDCHFHAEGVTNIQKYSERRGRGAG